MTDLDFAMTEIEMEIAETDPASVLYADLCNELRMLEYEQQEAFTPHDAAKITACFSCDEQNPNG